MNTSKDLKHLVGKRIAYIRKLKKFTQEQFSEFCNISISSLADIERGVSFPKAETLMKIMDVLQISPVELFNFEVYKSSKEKLEYIKRVIELIKNDESKVNTLYGFVKNVF